MGFFLTAFLVGLVGIIVAFVLPQTRRHAVTYAAIAVGDLWYVALVSSKRCRAKTALALAGDETTSGFFVHIIWKRLRSFPQ